MKIKFFPKKVQNEKNQNIAEEFSTLHNQFEKKCKLNNDENFEDCKRILAEKYLNEISELEAGRFFYGHI